MSIDPSSNDLFRVAFSGLPPNLCCSLWPSTAAADTQYRRKVFKGTHVTDGRIHKSILRFAAGNYNVMINSSSKTDADFL